MSETYISSELRRLISERANGLCEYCLVHEEDTFFGCQVDHIISISENLADACVYCNRYKGSDVGSVLASDQFSRFFNPRIDYWFDHFLLEGERITPKTAIGQVTETILRFNIQERLLERRDLRESGCYPASAAWARIGQLPWR